MKPPRQIRVPGKPAPVSKKPAALPAPKARSQASSPTNRPATYESSASMVFLDMALINIRDIRREAEHPPLRVSLYAPEPAEQREVNVRVNNIMRLSSQPLLIGHLIGWITNGAPIRIMQDNRDFRHDHTPSVWYLRSLAIRSPEVLGGNYDRSDQHFDMEFIAR